MIQFKKPLAPRISELLNSGEYLAFGALVM